MLWRCIVVSEASGVTVPPASPLSNRQRFIRLSSLPLHSSRASGDHWIVLTHPWWPFKIDESS